MSDQAKERPILFSGPMVRAILEGRKTQTRRVVKNATDHWSPSVVGEFFPTVVDRWGNEEPGCRLFGAGDPDGDCWICCPYGKPGERLWVRETFCELRREHFQDTTQPRDAMLAWVNRKNGCAYAAEITPGSDSDDIRKEYGYKWKPSIHMPRWASRITLEITSVRVERLNDISEADAIAEGCAASHPSIDAISREFGYKDFARSQFGQLWESINGPGSWAANPWVWVVEFATTSASSAAPRETPTRQTDGGEA